MEIHGAPIARTWVKLGQTARKGDGTVFLADAVTGWRVGDRVILTATETHNNGREKGTLRAGANGRQAFTEERTITAIARPVTHPGTSLLPRIIWYAESTAARWPT